MVTDRATSVDIEYDLLYGVVQQVVGNTEFQIIHWTCTSLGWNASNAVTGGLYRVSGDAMVRGDIIPWSIVLKIVRPVPEANCLSHYSYWKREVLAYQSGMLDTLPRGIRAPKCFSVTERPDGAVWLWLEEIVDSSAGEWSWHQYADAARCLGSFNGAYLSGTPLPDYDWLCRSWLRSWVEECSKFVGTLHRHETTWNDCFVTQAFPVSMFHRFDRLFTDRHDFIDALQKLPRVLCHNDAWRPNLFLTIDETGHQQLVAIDWAFTGITGVGEELGRFFGLTLNGKQIDQSNIRAFDKLFFESYVEGLHIAGWNGDIRLVRIGFCVSVALRCIMYLPRVLKLAIDRDRHFEWEMNNHKSITDGLKEMAAKALILLDFADEARDLIMQLH